MDLKSSTPVPQSQMGSMVNINTDDVQKLLLDAQEHSDRVGQQTLTVSKEKTETKSPVLQIIMGNEMDAKKDLLRGFIQKVANTGSDILTSPDKGKREASLLSDLQLIFGGNGLKEDHISLSAEARIGQMALAASGKKADRAKITLESGDDSSDTSEQAKELESHVFSENTGVRGQVKSPQAQPSSALPQQEARDASMDGGDFLEALEDKLNEDSESEEENASKKLNLSASQRILGLSDESGADGGGDPGDRQNEKEDDQPVDKKKFLDQIRESSKAGVEESSDSSTEDDSDSDLDDQVNKEHAGDNDVELESGGRIQLSESGEQSRDGGRRQGQEKEETKTTGLRKKAKVVVTEAQDTKSDVIVDYSNAFRSSLLSPQKNTNYLREMEDLLLKKHGLTSRQVKEIQMSVKKNIKLEIRDNIKDAILQKQMTVHNQLDSAAADLRLSKFSEFFVNNLLLGGADFGNFDEGFQGLINRAMYYASKDLADFAIDDLGHFVMTETIDKSKTKEDRVRDFEKKVNELNAITSNPKITEEWAQTAMEAFMKNYGLAKEDIDFSKQVSAGLTVDVNTSDGGFGGQQQRRENHGYEFDEKDEKDLFINRLRALYLQRALSPGLGTALQTEFKIRKLKNGLLKMGVYTDVLNENIQKEAKLIARDRIVDMLREALSERASFFELRGAAYDLVENKIKGLLKNADTAGLSISKREFDQLRDEANLKMFEITEHEMEMIGVRLAQEDLPALVLKYRDMKKLLLRLKTESRMDEEVEESSMLSRMTIVETA